MVCDEQLPSASTSAEAGENTTALRHNVNESKIMEKYAKVWKIWRVFWSLKKYNKIMQNKIKIIKKVHNNLHFFSTNE